MSQAPTPQQQAVYTRKVKNFLLDSRFQLKFAGYFVLLTMLVATWLGLFLVQTTDRLFHEVSQAVEARSQAAATSKELGVCSLNNDLAKSIDDPDFAKTLEAKSKAIDEKFEADKAAVLAEQKGLQEQQTRTIWTLVTFLIALILGVGLAAIVLTHRIVGPLFRIKRMAREVAQGKIEVPTYGLRPSDELHDVFNLMSDMIKALRTRAESDLAAVQAAVKGDTAALEKLKSELEARLAKQP
jgi:HAMP domain-containing protein